MYITLDGKRLALSELLMLVNAFQHLEQVLLMTTQTFKYTLKVCI